MRVFAKRIAALSTLFLLNTAATANAVQFQLADGVDGAFDTTLSIGANIRTQKKDKDLIGRARGGNADSINYDEGDENWGRGVTAFAVKATHELAIDSDNYGAFARATYFYDFVNARSNKLSHKSKEEAGRDFKLLDAYIYGDLEDSWNVPLSIKLGRQVINWGESTFILGGINSINPINVSAVRVPGAEVRDALEPILAFDATLGLTENLSAEAFYQYGFEKTTLEAAGTFFSTNNFASPGGDMVFLGFGDPQIKPSSTQGFVLSAPTGTNLGDPIGSAGNVIGPLAPLGAWIPRGGDDKPDHHGQFGLAARYFAPWFNDTEFGFYYTQLHSRRPLISAKLASKDQYDAAPTSYANNSRYFLQYPERIRTIGTSFATDLGSSGISWSGEVSHRRNQPLQVHSVDLLQAALAPAGVALTESSVPGAGVLAAQRFNTNPIIQELGGINTTGTGAQAAEDAGRFFGKEMKGYRRKKVTQLQTTVTKLFGPMWNAEQWVLVGELGMVHIHHMPSPSKFRFDASGLYNGGNPAFLGQGGMLKTQKLSDFPDANSYGYKLLARFDYLDVWDGVSLFPRISFAHDFKGTTPLPLGTFVKNRKAIGLGINMSYLEAFSADLSYTHFYGGGNKNLIKDRDFIGVNLKYSF